MIIGTAGHIDHGKTALVHALTGVDTDRLPEEKRRGLTIELGFAELALADGRSAGVVDVPGHERFVRTMVAGTCGIDLVLLVVAADDGIMPQTREHLEIVELLGARAGVVALNKIDRADPARSNAVTAEISALLARGPLRGAPVVPVSALTGEGIETLRQALTQALAGMPERAADGFFRLAVDRVFVKPGFGPVATGTVAAGAVREGDTVRLLPGGGGARVRGVQRHGRAAPAAAAGQRCAVNLAGVQAGALRRGVTLCDARLQRAAHTVDALVTLARDLAQPPRSHGWLRFHAGTAEVRARLVWLDDPPAGGGRALAQIRLAEPIAVVYGDAFILRSDSRQRTLGGGRVLDAFAPRRGAHLAQHVDRLRRLAAADAGAAAGIWLQAHGAGGWYLRELGEQLALPPPALEAVLARRADLYRATLGGEPWIALDAAVAALGGELVAAVAHYLDAHPRTSALPEATLHATACPWLARPVFRALCDKLVSEGTLERTRDGLRPPGHSQRFGPAEQALSQRVQAALEFRGRPIPKLTALAHMLERPPASIRRFLGELERAGQVVQIARDVYVTAGDESAWRHAAADHLQQHGRLTLAEFRDRIGAGRELALQILEHFDRSGLTRRAGDARVAAGSAGAEQACG
jgi:selenocysteine-specific elongation factor